MSEEVKALPGLMHIKCFAVDIRPFKQAVCVIAEQWMREVTASLAVKLNATVDILMQYLEHVHEGLEARVGDECQMTRTGISSHCASTNLFVPIEPLVYDMNKNFSTSKTWTLDSKLRMMKSTADNKDLIANSFEPLRQVMVMVKRWGCEFDEIKQTFISQGPTSWKNLRRKVVLVRAVLSKSTGEGLTRVKAEASALDNKVRSRDDDDNSFLDFKILRQVC